MKQSTRNELRVAAACGAVVLLVCLGLGCPLLIGIWPPDILTGAHHTLANTALPDGNSFKVIQYWNYADFYTTELVHTAPDGTVSTEVLDGDDSKTWRVPLTADEKARTVTVVLGGGRRESRPW